MDLMRNLAAFLLHRLGNVFNAAALGLQKLGFIVEFGADWRDRRNQHYREKLTRAHWKYQTGPN
jgi:hypothetical protein